MISRQTRRRLRLLKSSNEWLEKQLSALRSNYAHLSADKGTVQRELEGTKDKMRRAFDERDAAERIMVEQFNELRDLTATVIRMANERVGETRSVTIGPPEFKATGSMNIRRGAE